MGIIDKSPFDEDTTKAIGALIGLSLLFGGGDGDGDGGGNGDDGGGDGNQAPSASISVSPSTSVTVGTTVTLDGSGSSDPDGSIVAYQWTLTGPTGSTQTISGQTATFIPQETGTWTVELAVTDDSGAASVTTREVTASSDGGGGNESPTANFVWSSSPVVGQPVTLDASGSSDPDGSIGSWDWEIHAPSSGMTQRSGEIIEFTPSESGDYTVLLTVTDDDGATASEQSVITVASDGGNGGGTNEAPTADIVLSDTEVGIGQLVTADGSGSSDPDGAIASYEWWVEDATGTMFGPFSGSSVEFGVSDETGDWTVELTVTDDDGATDTTTAVFTVVGDGGGSNELPTADIQLSPSASVTTGTTVTADGTGSTDPDGTITSYEWMLEQPDGDVHGPISGSTTSFQVQETGDWTVELTVTDDDGGTDMATTTLSVTSGGTTGEVEIALYQGADLTAANGRIPERVVARYMEESLSRAGLTPNIQRNFDEISVPSDASALCERSTDASWYQEWYDMVKSGNVPHTASHSNMLLINHDEGGQGCAGLSDNVALCAAGAIDVDREYLVEAYADTLEFQLWASLHELSHNLGAAHDEDPASGEQPPGMSWNEDGFYKFTPASFVYPSDRENACGELVEGRDSTTTAVVYEYWPCTVSIWDQV